MSIERGVKYLTQCDVLYCGRGDAKNFNVTTYRLLPKVVDYTSPTANKSFEYYIYMRHINVLQLHVFGIVHGIRSIFYRSFILFILR